MRLAADIILGFELTLSVSRIRLLRIIQPDRTEGLFVSQAVAAQATHQKEFLRFASGSSQCFYKVMRIFCVDTEEAFFIRRFGQAGIVDHIIPRAMLTGKVGQLRCQRFRVVIFEIDKTDPFILQVLPATAGTYTRPGFISSAQRFFYQKTADKTACSCNQYLHILVFILHIIGVVIPQQADPVEYDNNYYPDDLLSPADKRILRNRLAAKQNNSDANNNAEFRQ